MEPGADWWKRLCAEIRKNRVVPVVGPELLTYHRELRAPLAQEFDLEPDHYTDIIQMAGAYERQAPGMYGSFTRSFVERLSDYDDRSGFLDWLMSNQAFRTILTTDYGTLLERLGSGAGKASTLRPLFWDADERRTQILTDGVPGLWTESDDDDSGRRVLHLLGHICRPETLAVTRAQQLDCLQTLQTRGIEELRQLLGADKIFLFLGVDFPEWLAGFLSLVLYGSSFCRVSYKEELHVVANQSTSPNSEARSDLNDLLRSKGITLYPGDARQFLQELEKHFVPADQHIPGGHIFISYSHDDAEVANKIAEELRSQSSCKFDVWLDSHRLGAGDQFRPDIERAIDEAAAFVPLLTENFVAGLRQGKYVKEECVAAVGTQRLVQRQPDRVYKNFVHPLVCSNALSEAKAGGALGEVYASLGELSIDRYEPGGALPSLFVEHLISARKAWRESHAR